MATKSNGGDPCYNKALPDEPIFVLRAQDKLAPHIVRAWANMASAYGVPMSKVKDAYNLAHEMEKWQGKAGNKAKVPD